MLWSPEPVVGVQGFFGPAWLWLFEVLTTLGNAEAIIVAIALALWLVGREAAYFILALTVLGTIVNGVLWTILGVPRPLDPRIAVLEQVTVTSLPSGHTVMATLLWGALARLHVIPTVGAALIVIILMLSRLYLGVHHLGDVLVSVPLGLLLLVIAIRIWPAVRRFLGRQATWVIVTLSLAGMAGGVGALFVDPTRWEIPGAAVGLAVGLWLEYRYLRFSPAAVARARQALKLLIGLGGMVPLIVAGLLASQAVPALGSVSPALAALWGLVVAPALFVRLGLSQRPCADQGKPTRERMALQGPGLATRDS